MKKNILHIIDTLGTGGAEKILINSINNLPQYNHIVVYLHAPHTLAYKINNAKIICLNVRYFWQLLQKVPTIRTICQQNNVTIIHSHLFIATLLARVAQNKNSKHIFSVHSTLSSTIFSHNPALLLLERLTYKKSHQAIFVSEAVRNDYTSWIGDKIKGDVLYNFVEDSFLRKKNDRRHTTNIFKIISVGNLKKQKNYTYLLAAFSKMKDLPVILDIYGSGPLRKNLLHTITSEHISNVRLKGFKDDLSETYSKYDAFTLMSKYEGYGIALAEALASGLPCIVSDLPVMREITQGNALYIDTINPDTYVEIIKKIINKKIRLSKFKSKRNYTTIANKDNYLLALRKIYDQTN